MTISLENQATVLGYEEALLGGLLTNPSELDREGMPRLTASDFQDPRHGTLYSAIVKAWARTGLSEPQTVVAELDASGELARVGGPVRIADLVGCAAVSGAIQWHAERVIEAAKLRAINAAAVRVQQAVTGPVPVDAHDFDRLLSATWTDLQAAFTQTHESGGGKHVTLGEVARDRITELLSGIEEPCIPTGLIDLDRVAKLLVPGRVTIIGARPAVGKSVLALQVAAHAAALNNRTLFMSLEMSRNELVDRIAANLGHIPHDRIMHPRTLTDADKARLISLREQVENFPLEIMDMQRGSLTVADATARIRQGARGDNPFQLLVIDYIQLFPERAGVENRQVAVAEISRSIKRVAMEQNVAVLAVAQVNRGAESTSDRRPLLSMLKDSGALEADADQVLLLHRDDTTNPNSERAGMMDIIIAKARHGATTTVPVATMFDYCRIDNLAHGT